MDCRIKSGNDDQMKHFMAGSYPGPLRLGLLFKTFDLAGFEIGHADIVEALQHALLAVRVDVEFDHAAVGAADFLLLQIDAERRIGAALGVVEQFFQILEATP